MKKVLIFSIIFFIICLSINLISKAYSEKFITFEYKTKKIIYQNEEEIEKNYNKKVKIENNSQIKIENITIKLIEKNENDYIVEINGDIFETQKIQECKVEDQKYNLKYNEEYDISVEETYITFKANN